MWSRPQRIFHSIICSRVILMVLKQRRKVIDGDNKAAGIDSKAWRQVEMRFLAPSRN